MNYRDAVEARDILNRIEALREFTNALNRKLSTSSRSTNLILEIDDGFSADNYDEPSDPIRIKLSDNMVSVVRDELNKESTKLYKRLNALGEEDKDG